MLWTWIYGLCALSFLIGWWLGWRMAKKHYTSKVTWNEATAEAIATARENDAQRHALREAELQRIRQLAREGHIS